MFYKKIDYLKMKIKWSKSDDSQYPFFTTVNENKLQIKLNDFPDEQLYSLIVNSEKTESFDDWPTNWERIK